MNLFKRLRELFKRLEELSEAFPNDELRLSDAGLSVVLTNGAAHDIRWEDIKTIWDEESSGLIHLATGSGRVISVRWGGAANEEAWDALMARPEFDWDAWEQGCLAPNPVCVRVWPLA